MGEDGELLHCLAIPEFIVPLVVVVIVEVVEGFLLFLAQCFEGEVMLRRDSRMIHVSFFPVGNEQYVTDECVEFFFQLEAFLIVLFFEVGFHFPLCVKLRTHGVIVMVGVLHECIAYRVALFAEYCIQYVVVDERLRHEFLV